MRVGFRRWFEPFEDDKGKEGLEAYTKLVDGGGGLIPSIPEGFSITPCRSRPVGDRNASPTIERLAPRCHVVVAGSEFVCIDCVAHAADCMNGTELLLPGAASWRQVRNCDLTPTSLGCAPLNCDCIR